MAMAREVSSVIDNSLTIPLPQLSGIAHGEDHEPIILKWTREELMQRLPADVQRAIWLRQDYLSRVLRGETINHSDSIGGASRELKITRHGVELVSFERDA